MYAVGGHMEWAGSGKHMRGVPRKIVIGVVGLFAKTVATLLNNTTVHNPNTLLRLIRSRPSGVPLITVSNHMSTSVGFFLLLLLSYLIHMYVPISIQVR